jgi:hypothetical protein
MHNTIAMHVVDSLAELVDYFGSFLGTEFFILMVLLNQFVAVSVCAKFANQIHILFVVEVAIKLNEVGVVQKLLKFDLAKKVLLNFKSFESFL